MGTLGQLIREARKAQGISQAQVAELSGVGLNTIHKIEANRTDVSLRNLLAIADAVGVKIIARSPLGGEVPLHD